MMRAQQVEHCPLCHACHSLTAKCWAQRGHAQAAVADGMFAAQSGPDGAAWPTLTGLTTSDRVEAGPPGLWSAAEASLECSSP